MKKVLFILAIVGMLVSCTSCDFRIGRYSKMLVTVERPLKGFERIQQMGTMSVEYVQADSFSVKVKAPKEVVDQVETRVEGNVLIVNMKGGTNFLNFGVADGKDVTVYVTSPDFLGIELVGTGDFSCKNLLDTDNLDVVLKGTGDVEFDHVICDNINVSLVGTGEIDVKKVRTLQALVELTGAGDVEVNFDEAGFVDSRLLGTGDIKLTGTVRQLKKQVRGVGDMDTDELIVKEQM